MSGYQLPEKLKALTPYQPLSGSYAIRLDANESFLTPPEELRQALGNAMASVPFNRYPDPYCVALREKCGAFFGIDPAHLVAGNGSDELIGLIISTFTHPGGTVVTVSPDFSMYGFYAQICGVNVKTFTKETHQLALDADGLIAFVQEHEAELVILSNPCNPTSLAASRADVLKIVSSLHCLVVIDEAYMDFSQGSVLDVAHTQDNLIVLKTCSKAFGMAAIRLGFAVASPPIVRALNAVKSPYNVNAMTQAAGCVLLDQQTYLLDCITQIKVSRDALYHALTQLTADRGTSVTVLNSCGNFVFLQLPQAEQAAEHLKSRGIAVRCMPPYLRISAGNPTENAAVVAALTAILQEETQ